MSYYRRKGKEWGRKNPVASGILGLVVGAFFIIIPLAVGVFPIALVGVWIIIGSIRRIYGAKHEAASEGDRAASERGKKNARTVDSLA